MESLQSLSRPALQKSIHSALRAWHNTGKSAANLLDSLLLVRERRARLGETASPALLRLATNQVLLEAIDELEKQDESAARLLRWRFPDDNTLLMVGNKLNVSDHSVSRKQRTAIEQLAEILFAQEIALRQQKAQALAAHLPPASYSRLIGLNEARSQLVGKLIQPGSPWTIAIVGIGGIGKTALADAVTRQLLPEFHFEQIIWLRTEPQPLSGRSHSSETAYENLIADLAERLWPQAADFTPAKRLEQVRQALKSQPHLIIVDNLETEMDTAVLLAHLNGLANPSKFLLTSRTRPAADAAVYSHSLGELSPADASALLRHHAREIGMTHLAEADEAELAGIYAVTGGNPLALKLVISLLDVLPLSQILVGLSRSQAGPIEKLYRHIYWRTWETLDDEARTLLLAMPLVSRAGARPEQLLAITHLTEPQFWLALQALRKRSLLEVRGSLTDRRYGIHRLTETFLQTEIIKIPDDGE